MSNQGDTNDLHDFMDQMTRHMASDYERIRKRATQDPGTAGDAGEAVWTELLCGWIPSTYHIVTKGRIMNHLGQAGPQVDVLVLKPSYPPRLRESRMYLSSGVAAAFECKLTLEAGHIGEAVANCVRIKSLYQNRFGTPYLELHSPIVYGLLAQSHSWKQPASTPVENIASKLKEQDLQAVRHPRQALDLLCVADLASWSSVAMSYISPTASVSGPGCLAQTVYFQQSTQDGDQVSTFRPLGALISGLFQKMAWSDTSMRDLADYYRSSNLAGNGQGKPRVWDPALVYSEEVRGRLLREGAHTGLVWDEWALALM